jgi:hypothetical protein
MTTRRGRDPIHVTTWLGYSIWMQPTNHPTRPELSSYYNADLDLWLVEHNEKVTFYAADIAFASAPDNNTLDATNHAFERLLSSLDCVISGPYPDTERAQRAAEWLADLEGL